MGIGPPPQSLVGPIWLIIVVAFVILLVGGFGGVAFMTYIGKDPKDILPVVTAALGVLAGLLAPSPVAGK
jgi:predicted permease